MTILRIDMAVGGWRPIPPKLLEDDRLSLDARAVAAFIATRTEKFRLNVRGLCTLLNLGEAKWRRIRDELIDAGYLQLVPSKDDRGRFKHQLIFSPIPRGGFQSKRKSPAEIHLPNNPCYPGMVDAVATKPEPDEFSTTKKGSYGKSKNHHPEPLRSGTNDHVDSTLPDGWLEAANHEIEVEKSANSVRNGDGLFHAIIKRYRSNGGPGQFVLDSLKQKNLAEKKKAELGRVDIQF